MSILTAIHARWDASATLIALLPSSQFVTGIRGDGTDHVPLVMLERQAETKGWTNSKPLYTTSIKLTLWVRKHVDGENIKAAIEDQFDNAHWETGLVTVTKCRIANSFELADPDDDTIWQFHFDLETDHHNE